MRVYISVDMEGIAGVVHAEQVRRGQADYDHARKLMTLEANAAALGALEAGAAEVLVNDAHGDMRNLLIDELDRRVEVLSGAHKPYSMVEGILAGGYDLGMFVGYHAGAGTADAVLDHTYWGAIVSRVTVNGQVMNEASLNALVAGAAGTPVGLVTGDETTCRQCRELLGPVETVAVKWAVGRLAARSLHPEVARERIRAAAATAVRERGRFTPYRLEAPYLLHIDMQTTAMADAAMIMPYTERHDARGVLFRADRIEVVFRALLALTTLAGEGRI
jgi:D-amino peptidase